MKKRIFLTMALAIAFVAANANVIALDKDKSGDKSKEEKTREKENVVNKENVITAEKKWEFFSLIKEPTAEELAQAGNYKFGQQTGCLYDMFLEVYVAREEVVPGDPTRRTIIRKPGIYNAVRSIEKHLSKEYKNKSISKEDAAENFSKVLKIAISALDSDNDSFEDTLQANRKNTEQLLAVFQNATLTEF